MDVFEAITTKIEVREYDSKKAVPKDIKLKVLEAARLTGSGINVQEWRFILVEDSRNLKQLADDSTSGKWVAGANFAVIILTDPSKDFHQIDAGRALQDMQIAAWSFGVGSGLFTGFQNQKLRKDYAIPSNLEPTIVVGFGYPAKKITGKRKNRMPLEEIAYLEKYGNKLDQARIS